MSSGNSSDARAMTDTDPSALADLSGYTTWLSDGRKRQLLETPDVAERLEALIGWTKEHLAEVEVNDKLADDVREHIEKGQREYLLRQQLAAIRDKLQHPDHQGQVKVTPEDHKLMDRDFEGGFGGQEDLEDRYATTLGEH